MTNGELWHLRPELEYTERVDSWNVRATPSFDAACVAVIRAGQPFSVLQQVGEWVQVRAPSAGDRVSGAVEGSGELAADGWSYVKFGESDALVPISHVASALPESDPRTPMSHSKSNDRVAGLLTELGQRRLALEQATAAATIPEPAKKNGEEIADSEEVKEVRRQRRNSTIELVRKASEVQDTMDRLELLGVEKDQLLAVEGAEALAERANELTSALRDEIYRTTSFKHMDFSNPEADSCWLSTFFQSLWHSRVFHALFDRLVRPLPEQDGATATKALRETWELYERASSAGSLVPVKALVKAWGAGYGDCAEAFGVLQQEAALKPLADQLALVAVPFTGTTMTPSTLWDSVVEAGVTSAPLLALDLMLPLMLPSASILTLALALLPRRPMWRPETRQVDGAPVVGPDLPPPPDLGEEHRLVAMICYMESVSHYVVFCRRQSAAGRWRLFNDLDDLASGVRRELNSWAEVAHECARYELRPKVLFYESSPAAERALAYAGPQLRASIEAAAAHGSSEKKAGSPVDLQSCAIAFGVVIIVALIAKQIADIYGILA
eukprot:TRINITY_DN40238_c0_g1_i1.p1 TRINITY_DN40238_c0_g1~~TRINITY_DN40238_c0_g1_i1.p1  ORF type:complete len:590 (-),score=115.67 TRINITY_DN40238_c0_g1_i1:47-1711(-)